MTEIYDDVIRNELPITEHESILICYSIQAIQGAINLDRDAVAASLYSLQTFDRNCFQRLQNIVDRILMLNGQ